MNKEIPPSLLKDLEKDTLIYGARVKQFVQDLKGLGFVPDNRISNVYDFRNGDTCIRWRAGSNFACIQRLACELQARQPVFSINRPRRKIIRLIRELYPRPTPIQEIELFDAWLARYRKYVYAPRFDPDPMQKDWNDKMNERINETVETAIDLIRLKHELIETAKHTYGERLDSIREYIRRIDQKLNSDETAKLL